MPHQFRINSCWRYLSTYVECYKVHYFPVRSSNVRYIEVSERKLARENPGKTKLHPFCKKPGEPQHVTLSMHTSHASRIGHGIAPGRVSDFDCAWKFTVDTVAVSKFCLDETYEFQVSSRSNVQGRLAINYFRQFFQTVLNPSWTPQKFGVNVAAPGRLQLGKRVAIGELPEMLASSPQIASCGGTAQTHDDFVLNSAKHDMIRLHELIQIAVVYSM